MKQTIASTNIPTVPKSLRWSTNAKRVTLLLVVASLAKLLRVEVVINQRVQSPVPIKTNNANPWSNNTNVQPNSEHLMVFKHCQIFAATHANQVLIKIQDKTMLLHPELREQMKENHHKMAAMDVRTDLTNVKDSQIHIHAILPI